jgi:hypothetical protein
MNEASVYHNKFQLMSTVWWQVSLSFVNFLRFKSIIFCDMTPYNLVDVLPTFWKNVLPTSSRGISWHALRSFGWRQYVPPKRRWIYIAFHDLSSKLAILFSQHSQNREFNTIRFGLWVIWKTWRIRWIQMWGLIDLFSYRDYQHRM